MNKFQLILSGIFGVMIVVGVAVFSGYKGSSVNSVTVTVWGTIPSNTFNDILFKSSLRDNEQYKVEYKEIPQEDFDNSFIEALASGKGPDLFMLPSDKIVKHKNKILIIPYNVYTARQFKDNFIEGAEIYMSPEGIIALPITVDPLVMYWNRSMFNNAKITQPPKYWDEFYSLATAMTKKDGSLNITKSAVSFGEFVNVSNAKEIFINLALQAGTPITMWGQTQPVIVFSDSFGRPTIPAEAATNFYTEFSNPAKPAYSWNRSLPQSLDYFISGDLALYFGFSSEISSIQLKNPNLNFDVTTIPVAKEGGSNVSFGKFNAFAITKASVNQNSAFDVALILSGSDAKVFSEVLNLPPVRRDLLSKKQIDSYKAVFYDSAIRSVSWLDPDPNKTNIIFKNMIESITSGRLRTTESIFRAQKDLADLITING